MTQLIAKRPTVREYRLERLQYVVRQQLGPNLASSVHAESYMDHVTTDMVLQLKANVWGQKREKTIRFPATWWDAFKARWQDSFWFQTLSVVVFLFTLGRVYLMSDVQYRDIRAELWETFPNLKIAGNDGIAHHFLAFDSVTDEPVQV